MLRSSWVAPREALVRLAICSAVATVAAGCAPIASRLRADIPAPHYDIRIDAARPAEAEVRLAVPLAPARLTPARDGDGAGISDVRCEDGRAAEREGMSWTVPPGCTRFIWRVALEDLDANGVDASLPIAAYSRRHSYWLLPERDGLLRATSDSGTVLMRLRLTDGHTGERRYMFPSNNQPPFYAIIGSRPRHEYSSNGFVMRVFGAPPDYGWMRAIHDHVLESWARWRRDLVSGTVPERIDWAWVQPPRDLSPGYNASAGAEAIVSQIKLREGDPDAEAKARVVIATSAAHEGFHTIVGAAGQAWPAWVGESLANHYAITAARTFLAPEDHRWLEAIYIEPEVQVPLLDAQARYSAGDGGQGQVFYTYGARFWREIERVLTNEPNGSGRLAALIQESNDFAGTNLTDAEEVADLLDAHSNGRARPIVLCFLRGIGCSGT